MEEGVKYSYFQTFYENPCQLTDVLQFRGGLGELFLLALGELAAVFLVSAAALVGFSALAAATDLLPTTGVVHRGRRHVLADTGSCSFAPVVSQPQTRSRSI